MQKKPADQTEFFLVQLTEPAIGEQTACGNSRDDKMSAPDANSKNLP